MKSTVLAGLLLVVLGVLVLAYQGITYTKQRKVVDLGPIQATTKTEKHIPLPPILGAVAVLGGVVLVFAGGRQS
jgi:drug/metabolite transporter (DMT)-like permease